MGLKALHFLKQRKFTIWAFSTQKKKHGSNTPGLEHSVFLRLQIWKTKRQAGQVYRYSWDCFLSHFLPLHFPVPLWQEIVVFLGKQVCEHALAIRSFASQTCPSLTVLPDISWLQSCSWNSILGCTSVLRMRRETNVFKKCCSDLGIYWSIWATLGK